MNAAATHDSPALLQGPLQAAHWLRAHVRGELRTDSRRVRGGDGFIAWPGAASDGRAHVNAALAAGASACLVEQEGVAAFSFDDGARVHAYPGLKAACGAIAAAYYEQPSRQLDLLAVTGTNGKTSTAWWLAQALSAVERDTGRGAGRAAPCGLIGTLGAGLPPRLEPTGLTTPDPVLLQRMLRRFADAGARACAIEASSIGLAERRLDGAGIRVAIFTNFSQDHLDYHGDMANYWQAKAGLFRWPGLQAAVLNIDDPRGTLLATELSGALDVWTTSCRHDARLRADAIVHDAGGLAFDVVEGASIERLRTGLIGDFNAANLLGVIATLRALGLALAEAVAACAALTPVPGRMETLGGDGQPLAVIDYAHTPDALDKALAALRPLARARGGALCCVFGCGGGRDAGKRPLMGAAAERGADRVIVTSDNPRHEPPQAIIAQVLAGFARAPRVEADRGAAIGAALREAGARDVVLIAGKGHEAHQEIAGVRHPFSDREVALAALRALETAA